MRSLLVVLLLGHAVGCTSSGAPRSTASRDVITLDEIRSVNVTNAFEVVERLRPNFFTSRGPQSMLLTQQNVPVVYLNGTRYGTVESLTTLRVEQLKEIRLYRPSDASTTYGPGHTGGVIAVKTTE